MAMSTWQKYDENEHAVIKKEATILLSKLDIQGEAKPPQSKKDLKDVLLTSCKVGAEIMLGSEDPFQSMINILGKSCIGTSLSKLSCSQVAGIMGLVVTTLAPQMTVPLVLKKITDDIQYLKKSVDTLRTCPQYLACQYLSTALQNIQDNCYEESIEDLKTVKKQAIKACNLATNFEGTLRSWQLRMISSVLLECASQIEGVNCFLPLHILPLKKKQTIQKILEDGLSKIIMEAEQKTIWGNKITSQKRQDQLDPYLAGFYNSYSIASSFTQPYQDVVPELLVFTVNTNFIAEGEEDLVQVEILSNPLCEIVMFMWKEYTAKSSFLTIRYKKSTWKIKLLDKTIITFEFDHKKTSLSLNGCFIDKHVYWPDERVVVQKLFSGLRAKTLPSSRLFKWLGKKTDVYLRSVSIELNNKNKIGETIFHLLAEKKNSKPLSYIMNKCINVNEPDINGETPLHRAVKKGNIETSQLLLEWGANIDHMTNNSETPLMYACRFKQKFELIQLLIKNGANLELINKEGESHLDICRNSNASSSILKLVHPVYRQLM